MRPKEKRKPRQRLSTSCNDDYDCLRGMYCAIDVQKCMEERNQKFGEECERNGGNFHKILQK